MKFPTMILSKVLAIALLTTGSAIAQETPYREGSVWSVTLIKVKPGMLNTYIRDLGATRKPLMEEAKRQGLVVSEKMLSGGSANRDDFNMILMVEYKNWAAYDGLSDKFEALGRKVVGSEDKQMQISVKRADVREIFGSKNMQELTYK